MLACRRVATRISGRFVQKRAENRQIGHILAPLNPFICLGAKKKEPDHWPGSIRVLGYQELLVMPASLEHGHGEFRSYRNSQDRLDETTTGGDQVSHD